MLEINTKMEIKTTPEAIYQAFVDKDLIGKFWFSHSSENWTKGAQVNLSYDEFEANVPIEILELRENRKIIFSWGPESDSRVITINIVPSADNTAVEIKEQGFQEYEDMLSNSELSAIRTFEYEEILSTLLNGKGGWTFVLTCLKAYLEHGVTDLRVGLMR